jgi:hypothetical protein
MTAAAMSPEEQLVEDIASFTYDPLGYALYAFPWGEEGTELAHATGPRKWQADAFREIRDHLQNPATRHQPLMLAGHPGTVSANPLSSQCSSTGACRPVRTARWW